LPEQNASVLIMDLDLEEEKRPAFDQSSIMVLEDELGARRLLRADSSDQASFLREDYGRRDSGL